MKGRSAVVLVMLVTPLVVAPLVVLGVYAGYYAGGALGYSKSILAIVFSTAGFLVSMLVMMKLITAVVSRTKTTTGAS